MSSIIHHQTTSTFLSIRSKSSSWHLSNSLTRLKIPLLFYSTIVPSSWPRALSNSITRPPRICFVLWAVWWLHTRYNWTWCRRTCDLPIKSKLLSSGWCHLGFPKEMGPQLWDINIVFSIGSSPIELSSCIENPENYPASTATNNFSRRKWATVARILWLARWNGFQALCFHQNSSGPEQCSFCYKLWEFAWFPMFLSFEFVLEKEREM